MKILITGIAGFIGFHLCKALLSKGHSLIGIDNINDYYKVSLKYDRLRELGIAQNLCVESVAVVSATNSNFTFLKMDVQNKTKLKELFENEGFDVVCHLAAQAGVRYSIENPDAYVESNLVGFVNILECCRSANVGHLVYASSSSVYGMNNKIPFSEDDITDMPISLYAATKKANELMAYTYSHLYKFATTGLRFFTVYGPWGRPDMSPMLFAKAIMNNQPIKVFNNGDMERDFTYVDDIVEGIVRVIEKTIKEREPYKIYNIGNSNSVKLDDFIVKIEENFGKKAKKEMCPMQMGDVKKTWADVSKLIADYGYKPKVQIADGVRLFADWYKDYIKKNSDV